MIRKRGAVFAAVMAVLLFVSAGFTGCSSQENGKSEKEEQTREETGKEEKADTADKKKEPVSVTAPEKSDASREPGKDSGEAKSSPNAPETSDPKDKGTNSGEQEMPEQKEQDTDSADTVSDDDLTIEEYVEKYGEEKALEKYGEVPFNKYYLRPKEAREKEAEQQENEILEYSGTVDENTDGVQ